MREIKLVSPLLDHMTVVDSLTPHGSTACYILKKDGSNTKYFLKHISLPESESSIRALILAGAVANEDGAQEYYGRIAEDYRSELDALIRLSDSPNIANILGYQIEPKEAQVGYDVFILSRFRETLAAYTASNAMTNLHAINLGIDICNALIACRQGGYLFQNLKPENIYVDEQHRFQLGDLGLAATEDLQYASVPENYIGCYTAPELCGISASLNLTADLYSLGLILYRIYNGNHAPFEDEETPEKAADQLRLSGRELPAPLYADYELAEIINKACAFHPENRYQTPEELQQALIQYMQRNSISDSLIVPPIVTDEKTELVTDLEEEETATPLSATDVSRLDAAFIENFTPDLDAVNAIPEAPQQDAEASSDDLDAEAAAPTPDAASPNVQDETQPAAADHEDTKDDNSAEHAEPQTEPEEDSLGALLKDVGNLIGSETDAENSDAAADAATESTTEQTEKEEARKEASSGRKKRILTIGCIALAVVLLVVGVYFLYTKWYCIHISKLEVTDLGTDTLTVQIDSSIRNPAMDITCMDTYRNSFLGDYKDGRVTFTGLTPGTDYTIVLSAKKFHKITGATKISVTTCVPTEITGFTVTDGSVSGAALLKLSYDGTAPEKWSVTYSSEGGTAATTEFTGTEYELTGLNLNENYTFQLNNTAGIFLTGETSASYYTLPFVMAENMTLAEITEGSLRVEWTTAADSYLPDSWSVTCSDDNGYSQTVEVTETTATFTDITPGHAYTITLNATGMREPYVTTLEANPLILSDLKATANSDGSITVTWTSQNGMPDGGWLITYGIGEEAYLQQADSVSENSYTIAHAVPDADYFITLSSTDNSTIIGDNTVNVTTAAAEKFNSYRVKPGNVYMAFFLEPTKANWTYIDLSERRSSFTPEESVSFVAQIGDEVSVQKSDDSIYILCVVRNSDGKAIDYYTATSTWNGMWYRNRYCGTLTRTPQAAGEYTVEIYLNNALLKSHSFTIE